LLCWLLVLIIVVVVVVVIVGVGQVMEQLDVDGNVGILLGEKVEGENGIEIDGVRPIG